nr:hypothetical protein [Massilia atriviolacea]
MQVEPSIKKVDQFVFQIVDTATIFLIGDEFRLIAGLTRKAFQIHAAIMRRNVEMHTSVFCILGFQR